MPYPTQPECVLDCAGPNRNLRQSWMPFHGQTRQISRSTLPGIIRKNNMPNLKGSGVSQRLMRLVLSDADVAIGKFCRSKHNRGFRWPHPLSISVSRLDVTCRFISEKICLAASGQGMAFVVWLAEPSGNTRRPQVLKRFFVSIA